MKIAIDARFYGLEHAGLGRYTKNLIEQLAQIDQINQYTLFVQSKYAGLNLASNFSTVVVDAPHHSLEEQLALTKAIGFHQFDLVHFPHYIVPITNFTTPFVVTVHDLIKHKHGGMEATTLPFWKYQIKHWAYRFDMWWAVRFSQHIITPTNYVKTDLVNWFGLRPEKIAVTFEGVDGGLVDQSKSTTDPRLVLNKYQLDGQYFLYVGNSYPYKHVEVLVDTLRSLPADVKLVLVGSRSIFHERLEKMMSGRDLANRVVSLGYVPDDDLRVIYAQAVAFASASAEEGFGIPPLEAMSVGCPVVLSDIPVHREVCGDAALYVDDFNPVFFADQIKKLLTDASLVDDLKNRGRKQVDRYSWRKMAEETLAVYQRAKLKENK